MILQLKPHTNRRDKQAEGNINMKFKKVNVYVRM